MNLKILSDNIEKCKACSLSKSLGEFETPTPFAGSINSDIMMVSMVAMPEAVMLNEPLSTKYSILVSKLLDESGISSDRCYFTNIVKCPSSKYLSAKDIKTCVKEHLLLEIELISPKHIVCFGTKTFEIISKLNLQCNIHSIPSLEHIYVRGVATYKEAIKGLEKVNT